MASKRGPKRGIENKETIETNIASIDVSSRFKTKGPKMQASTSEWTGLFSRSLDY
jgi:hypothetical protein